MGQPPTHRAFLFLCRSPPRYFKTYDVPLRRKEATLCAITGVCQTSLYLPQGRTTMSASSSSLATYRSSYSLPAFAILASVSTELACNELGTRLRGPKSRLPESQAHGPISTRSYQARFAPVREFDLSRCTSHLRKPSPLWAPLFRVELNVRKKFTDDEGGRAVET